MTQINEEEKLQKIADGIGELWLDLNSRLGDQTVLDCQMSALGNYNFDPDMDEYEYANEFIEHEVITQDMRPQLRPLLREKVMEQAKDTMVAILVDDIKCMNGEGLEFEVEEFITEHSSMLEFTENMGDKENDEFVEVICQMVTKALNEPQQ